jgi:hypothetical protein
MAITRREMHWLRMKLVAATTVWNGKNSLEAKACDSDN